jgi:hypothetical protein
VLALRVIGERSFGVQGHCLYAVTDPGQREGQTCLVVCKCGLRFQVAPVEQFERALYFSARDHVLRGANLPHWMTGGVLDG